MAPTISPLAQIRANIKDALEGRATKQTALDATIAVLSEEGRSTAGFNEAEQLAFDEARKSVNDADAEIVDLRKAEADIEKADEARKAAEAIDVKNEPEPEQRTAEPGKTTPSIAVTSEPLTYRKGGPNSYFRDLARANPQGGGEPDSQLRLARHRTEMQVEQRTNMNRTDGTGGEFVPPLWLMDQYLPLARAGRVTADLCRVLPLPPGTDSINLPKVSTGASTGEQSDAGSVSNTAITTTSVSGAVTTVAGQQVFAMQLLDQSPVNMDEVVFADLLADLAVRVDTYVLNKASIGILNVTGINSVTYTDASPTVPELYPKIADAKQRIDTNRYLPAQAIVMHPTRWAWHLASLDSQNRPLVTPSSTPYNAFAGFKDTRSEGVVGELQGLPVYVDANVPTTLGGGTEDAIVVARFDDLNLYEGSVRTRVLFETDADTLSVRLQVWEYLAFIGNRYPKSISKITGTGLAAATF